MKGSWDRERDPLAALSRGQPELFEAFVRSEAATLIGFFRRLGGSRVEAEDLTQEVFLKLYRHASDYQPQGTFEAFALRIARNAWIDRRRREAARVSARAFSVLESEAIVIREPLAAGHEPDQRLSGLEEQERIARALSSLSAKHAIIFELAIVQSRSYPEIAEELDIPVGTVKSRVFHALRRMRAALEEAQACALDLQAAREQARDARPTRAVKKNLGGPP